MTLSDFLPEYFAGFAIAWIYHAAMYLIAVKVLRARWWHALWMATLVSVSLAVFFTPGLEEYLTGNAGVPKIAVGLIFAVPLGVGFFLYKLVVLRFLFDPSPGGRKRPRWAWASADWPSLYMPLIACGHMGLLTLFFLPLFNLTIGLVAFLGLRRKSGSRA